MRIAYISRHPAPYRDPVLARIVKDDRVNVEVFNELKGDSGHLFWQLESHGYEAVDLFPRPMCWFRRVIYLVRKFSFGNYDFVLWPSFITSSIVVAMLVRAARGARFGFVADTVSESHGGILRKWLKKYIIGRASLIFVPGNKGRMFWRNNYMISDHKLVSGAYALDNQVIRFTINERVRLRNEFRAKLGIGGRDIVFLMVANMIPTRHYPITSNGFLEFAKSVTGVKFLMVGTGPDAPKMKEQARVHKKLIVRDGVSFDEMLSLYAIADVYVHGGVEPASTALLIGAIAGLPLVTSAAVGCSYDVVREGRSGVLVEDYKDPRAWADAFKKIMSIQESWSSYGVEAARLAGSLDASVVSRNLIDAILSKK